MVSGELLAMHTQELLGDCGLLNAKHDLSSPHTSFPHVPARCDPQDHRKE